MPLKILNPTVLSGQTIIHGQISTLTTAGSLSFSGTSSSNLSIANDVDLRMGSGNFTIEWFQYMDNTGGSFPRIFSIGTYSTASIAVSIESSSFYFWAGGSGNNMGIVSSNLINVWNHFAISRSGTSLRVFRNGTQLGSTLSNSTNYNDSSNVLRIGNESSLSSGAAYKGLITNFRWVKGTALYTSNFTTPTSTLQNVANTKLLLVVPSAANFDKDSSSSPKTIVNSSVTFSSTKPF